MYVGQCSKEKKSTIQTYQLQLHILQYFAEYLA